MDRNGWNGSYEQMSTSVSLRFFIIFDYAAFIGVIRSLKGQECMAESLHGGGSHGIGARYRT